MKSVIHLKNYYHTKFIPIKHANEIFKLYYKQQKELFINESFCHYLLNHNDKIIWINFECFVSCKFNYVSFCYYECRNKSLI